MRFGAVYGCMRLCGEMVCVRPMADLTERRRDIKQRTSLPPIQGRFGERNRGSSGRGLDERGTRVEEHRHDSEAFRRAEEDRQRERTGYPGGDVVRVAVLFLLPTPALAALTFIPSRACSTLDPMTHPDGPVPPHVALVAGGFAGAVEAACTYPFEFAKTRMQLRDETSARGASRPNPIGVVRDVVRTEGARALYKGCGSLVVGSIAKDGVRFLAFDAIKDAYKDPATGTLSPARSLLAGMSAGVLASLTAVTPTERVKTALIDDARHERRFRSTMHCVRTIWAEHGVRGFYRGLAGTTLKQASATACRLGTYNILKDYEREHGITQGVATNFGNGMVAGTLTTYATQPFDTIKTRSQSARGASAADAFRSILADEGVRGFWRGTVMRLGRTILAGGVLFTVYEQAAAVLMHTFPKP
jgi:solute carrier family 25 citrate transporter 1